MKNCKIDNFLKLLKKHKEIVFIAVLNILFFSRVFFTNSLLLEGNFLSIYYPWYSAEASSLVSPRNGFSGDSIFYTYPFYHFAVNAIKNGIVPLWNPYIGGGVNFFANVTFPLFYPGIILFYFLPIIEAWNLTIFLHLFFAGLGMFLFLRTIKLSPFSSLIGALVYNFGGFAFTFVWFPEYFFPWAWIPLVFLFFETYWQTKKKQLLILCGLSIASVDLTGQHIFFYFLLLLLIFYWFFKLVYEFRKGRKVSDLTRYSLKVCLAIILGILIASISFVPFLELMSVTSRGESVFSSMRSQDYLKPFVNTLKREGTADTPLVFALSFLMPNFFGNDADFKFLPYGILDDYSRVGPRYIGVLALVLFIFGLFSIRKNKNPYLFFFSFVSLFIILANFQLPSLLFLVPGNSIISMYHNRLLFLTSFTMPICAAIVLDYILKREDKACERQIHFLEYVVFSITLVTVLLVIGFQFFRKELLFAITAYLQPVFKYYPYLEPIALVRFEMRNIIIFALFLLSIYILLKLFFKNKINMVLFKSLCVLLVIADLFIAGMGFYPVCKRNQVYPLTQSLKFIKDNISNYRIITYKASNADNTTFIPSSIPPNIPMVFDIYNTGFYIAFSVQRYSEFIQLLNKVVSWNNSIYLTDLLSESAQLASPLLNLLNVKYVLSTENILINSTSSGRQLPIQLVYDKEINIYENKDVLPKAFIVSRYKVIKEKKEIYKELLSKEFNPKRYVVLENELSEMGSKNLSGQETFVVPRIIKYGINEVIIETDSPSSGILVLCDNYFPGWKAYIDNKEASVMPANLAFRAVALLSGKHTVKFIYQPDSLKIGALLSLSSLAVLIAMSIVL